MPLASPALFLVIYLPTDCAVGYKKFANFAAFIPVLHDQNTSVMPRK